MRLRGLKAESRLTFRSTLPLRQRETNPWQQTGSTTAAIPGHQDAAHRGFPPDLRIEDNLNDVLHSKSEGASATTHPLCFCR